MRIFTRNVSKMTANVFFVGSFIPAKTGITVYPEHGTAVTTSVGDEIFAYAVQTFIKCTDELDDRFDNRLLVSRLVRIEPFAIIVCSEFCKLLEQIFREAFKCHRHISTD
jgi:hypothetical protein